MLSKLVFAYVGFFAISSALSISALFDVQDLCASVTVDCLLAVSVFCTPIFNQYCTCIREDLDLDVAILLDASVGVQTSSIWADLTLAIPSALELEIKALEPLLDIDVLAFGDGNVLDISADLSISFPAYTISNVCPALLQAAASLNIDIPDLIILIAWSNLDITGCDFSLLANLRVYIISLGLNLDFSALVAGITANGGSVTVVNYCSSILCLQSLISVDIDLTVGSITSVLGDLFCEIFGEITTTTTSAATTTTSAATTTTTPVVTTTTTTTTEAPPATTTTTTTTTTPSPVISEQSITPSPTSRTHKPTKPKKTPKPTLIKKSTSAPVTPAPIVPVQDITPSPTKCSNTPSPVTPAPIVPVQDITPSPTKKWSHNTPSPVTPAPVTPAPIVPVQDITPSPTKRWV